MKTKGEMPWKTTQAAIFMAACGNLYKPNL
jgi:hypothetical protein